MAAQGNKACELAKGIRAGDRAMLARAITLIESKRADHRKSAHLLVQELLLEFPPGGRIVLFHQSGHRLAAILSIGQSSMFLAHGEELAGCLGLLVDLGECAVLWAAFADTPGTPGAGRWEP